MTPSRRPKGSRPPSADAPALSSQSPHGTSQDVQLWEWVSLALIVVIAIYLRFGRWDLLEFKGDESTALQLALAFVRQGQLPLAGLMSSVGVSNPPLFIYLLSPAVALNTDLAFITSFIAATGVAAVFVCWHVGRKYYNAAAGLAAAAMFAVSPWAIIYSRKIWAQDLVPLFAALTLWAVHALALGNRRRAIFWVVLLPLCMIQIHFSGFALTAAVLAILFFLRPSVDWRFALGGGLAALVLFAPYIYYQTNNHWADFRQAAQTIGNPRANPDGRLIDPVSGYPLPNRHYLTHAVSVMSAGEMEDALGLSKAEAERPLTFETWALRFQQFACVAGFLYLAGLAVRGARWSKTGPWMAVPDSRQVQAAWILVCWLAIPVLVYSATRLGTQLSYFVLFYPVPFLICGVAWQRLLFASPSRVARALLCGVLGVVLLGNVGYVRNLYDFLGRHGGAFGSYGTVAGYKQEAAAYLAEHFDVSQLLAENRLVQMDVFGGAQPPQSDVPLLAILDTTARKPSAATAMTTVMIVDRNRATFTPQQWEQLAGLSRKSFGPIELYFVEK